MVFAEDRVVFGGWLKDIVFVQLMEVAMLQDA
jgi:hypothetical protein